MGMGDVHGSRFAATGKKKQRAREPLPMAPSHPHRFLPTTMEEVRARGWDALDIIIVSGDAYVDHPAFGPVLIGRFLEGRGFRVGIIAQPDWTSPKAFKALGKPNLYFGVTAGNMDSMINRYILNAFYFFFQPEGQCNSTGSNSHQSNIPGTVISLQNFMRDAIDRTGNVFCV